MAEQNSYIIDEKELNDIQCDLHEIKKGYSKYCKTCEKNICNWCEGHDNHELIEFFSLDNKFKELYPKYEENLNKMESVNKNYFKNILLDFRKKKNEIEKILNDINKDISDIIKTEKLFENHLKFNIIIINAYKENKYNYYILKKFENLNFKYYKVNCDINKFDFVNNKEKTEQIKYFLKIKQKPEFKLPTINFEDNNNKDQMNGFNNMWISEKYCKSWGLREAIREFIQNQYDGIITKINNKKNLKVIKIGEKEKIYRKKVYLNFDLMNKKDNKIYGQIRYDYSQNTLIISNEGILWLGDFLLGGTKDENYNSDLI